MPKPDNMAETATDPGVTQDPQPPAAEPMAETATEAPRVAGAVVKKGKKGPTPEELGKNPEALVLVRISGKGDGRVHDGQGGRYEAGDEVVLPLGVAQNLRGEPNDRNALGYVEILEKV